jgi:hypothetical protein
MEAALALAAISGGFLYNRYKKVREGFNDTLVNPNVSNTFGPQFTQYVENVATRFNPIMNLVNPLNNPLYTAGSSPQQVEQTNKIIRNALRSVEAIPQENSFNLNPENMGGISVNSGKGATLIDAVPICEKITNVDCDAFDDPNFAANCGICHEGGKNSKGEPIFGGLLVLPNDKLSAEEGASIMHSRRINYTPTVGKCKPYKFSATKKHCKKLKNQLECESQQNFGIPGCSQCIQDEKFYSVDESAGKQDPYFILAGKGKITVKKMNSATGIDIDLSNSPKKVDMSDFKEGETVTFELKSGTDELAGYLEGNTASGLFSIDIIRLIQKDLVTDAKPRVTGVLQINSGNFNVMRPARGRSTAIFQLTNVFTFLDPTDEDAKLCSPSPFVTKADSAAVLNTSVCYKKDQVPGRYSLACLQETFTNAGCTVEGKSYPSTQEKANTLMTDETGKNLAVGEIAAKVYQASQEAYSGLRNGQKLSILEWDKVSQFCTGLSIKNPCSNPETNNPLSVDCLDYLWKNKGATETGPKPLGPTYTNNTKASSLSGSTIQFCTPNGSMAPIGQNGKENSNAISIARSKGSIQEVKNFYNNIHISANDNMKTDANRKKAIQECYGIDLRDIPAFDMKVGDNETMCVPQTKVPSMTGVVNNRGSLEVKDNWIWSFSINPTGIIRDGWANLFLVNTGGATNPGFGTRMPSLYFEPNTTRLYVGITAKDNKVYDNSPNIQLPLNQTTNVYISYIDDKLTVKYSGAVETISTITVPECFKGMGTFYATSPWNPPFIGTITNLSYCTFASKTLSVLDYLPGRSKTNRPNDVLPPQAVPPKPCLPRGATIYSGCGYGYGLKSAHDSQCGSLNATYKIIADGLPNSDPCKLQRGATLYLGCGYAYTSESERAKQCGANNGTIRWIGDGL